MKIKGTKEVVTCILKYIYLLTQCVRGYDSFKNHSLTHPIRTILLLVGRKNDMNVDFHFANVLL